MFLRLLRPEDVRRFPRHPARRTLYCLQRVSPGEGVNRAKDQSGITDFADYHKPEGGDNQEGSMMAENWADLAPPPTALPEGKNWHVFVSYRAVNRPWVLALYDILRGLGYMIFLDQYVLTAAAPLALSLGEALDASASAILIWS